MSIQTTLPVFTSEVEHEEIKSLVFDLDSEICWIGNRVLTLVDLEIEFGQLVDSMETAVYRGEERAYHSEHFRKVRILSELLNHTLNDLNKGYDKVDNIRNSLWKRILKKEENANKELNDNKNNVIKPSIPQIPADMKSEFNMN